MLFSSPDEICQPLFKTGHITSSLSLITLTFQEIFVGCLKLKDSWT